MDVYMSFHVHVECKLKIAVDSRTVGSPAQFCLIHMM